MRIARLRIKNWLCFRGEHELAFGPKVYAVLACLGDDPDRSNWSGKTGLLQATKFALYGEHRHRTEDEWISDGEPSGEVEETFDDGSRILRSRARGKRTTVYWFPPGGGEPAIQERAEEAIVEAVGLSKQDFEATAYWEQKQMARFIVARPEERTRIVGAWLRIEPIKDCEKMARLEAVAAELDAAKVEEHLKLLAEREAELRWQIKAVAGERTMPEVKAAIVEAVDTQRGKVATAESDLQKNAEAAAGRSRVSDYEQVRAEGLRVRAEADKRPKLPILQEAWQRAERGANAASIAFAEADRDATARAKVAQGAFDGRCPIADLECPARSDINVMRQVNASASERADRARTIALDELQTSKRAEQAARAELQEAERIGQRLESLREQATRLLPLAKAAKAAGEPEDPSVVRGRLENERAILMELSGAFARLEGWIEDLGKIEATRAKLLERRAELAKALAIPREGAAIFKAAQRRVAEGSLLQIEYEANDALASVGANLAVAVRWSREGKELASACEECGHPFGRSAKIKACEKCGAERGLKTENKLEIDLSRRSGAAEDLAGAAVQLAASRWLREARGTAWSAAFLDEPFGALDAAHRKGFAAHLTAMLGGRYGFEQAFVVAHHPSVLDALPGRIQVTSDGRWSRVEVVA